MEIINLSAAQPTTRKTGRKEITEFLGLSSTNLWSTGAKMNLQNCQKYQEWLVILCIASFSIALNNTDLHLFNYTSFRPNLEF